VYTVVAAVALALPAAAGAQDEAASPRTAWGDPDLQGVWNNATLTPFQRPVELGTQEFLTEEEAATIAQRNVDRNAALWEAPARATEAGGNVGAYNNFWMERGRTVVPTLRTSIITDPPNGRLPAVTPEVERWLNSDEAAYRTAVRRGDLPAATYEQLDGGDRCLWYRGVPSFPTGYNNNYLIVQNPDFVLILQEHIHDVRYIPLDGRPHLPASLRQFAGSSRGRWEGDTLVVETTNVRKTTANAGAVGGDPVLLRMADGGTDDTLTVTERFTRSGPDSLHYEFTIDDPTHFTQAVSGEFPFTAFPADELPFLFEYACHEGNYSMTNILGGERAQERATDQP
jgi:hypothetical protein